MDNKKIRFLNEVSEWYLRNGNYVGGMKKTNIPEDILKKMEYLKKKGYVKRRDTEPKRYVLKEKYRKKYNWENLLFTFILKKSKEDLKYKEIIEEKQHFLFDKHFINERDKEELHKIEDKYKKILIEQTPVSGLKEYIFNFTQFKDNKEIKGYNLLVSKILKTHSKKGIKKLFEYEFEHNYKSYWGVLNFLVSQEEIKILSCLNDREEIEEVLSYLGSISIEKVKNPFKPDLFSTIN